MKVFLIFLTFQYCIFFNNSFTHFDNMKIKNEIIPIIEPTKNIDHFIENIQYKLVFLLLLNFQLFTKQIPKLDKECEIFWDNIFERPRYTINNIAKKIFRNGFDSNTIEAEEECLNNNGIYLLLDIKYSKFIIYKNYEKYGNQHILFTEDLSFDEELCLSSICRDLYVNYYQDFLLNISEVMNVISDINKLGIFGFKYKSNKNSKYEEGNKRFNKLIKSFFVIISIIYIGCTIFFILKENKDENEEDNKNTKKKLNERKNHNKSVERKSELTLFSNISYENGNKISKFFNSFNLVNNLLLLNKKKEPLSNQNSLTEISTIIFIYYFLFYLQKILL